MSHGKAVAVGAAARADRRARRAGGDRGVRVAHPAERGGGASPLERGWSTRRTGTSVSILRANGAADIDGERRVTNLEDVFVLLTGEEIT